MIFIENLVCIMFLLRPYLNLIPYVDVYHNIDYALKYILLDTIILSRGYIGHMHRPYIQCI